MYIGEEKERGKRGSGARKVHLWLHVSQKKVSLYLTQSLVVHWRISLECKPSA